MTKLSVKSQMVDKYNQFNLLELEEVIDKLKERQKDSPSSMQAQDLSAARMALQQRQHYLKSQVMEFEQTNNRHLLFFNSTKGFVKLVGHSALFFAMTIADRLHWRYSLKLDTDHYYVSEDGVISFRSLANIATRLAEIDILPDTALDTPELHYFKLTKVYSEEQIAKLRDHSKEDIKRIMTVVLPTSPIPSLYDAIMQASQLIYYQFKHLSDHLARDTIGREMILTSYDMATEYLHYARSKDPKRHRHLRKIAESARELRFGIAYVSKLQILHHREVCKVLEYLIMIERIAAKAYLRETRNLTEAND